jgi:hypothetical protein
MVIKELFSKIQLIKLAEILQLRGQVLDVEFDKLHNNKPVNFYEYNI